MCLVYIITFLVPPLGVLIVSRKYALLINLILSFFFLVSIDEFTHLSRNIFQEGSSAIHNYIYFEILAFFESTKLIILWRIFFWACALFHGISIVNSVNQKKDIKQSKDKGKEKTTNSKATKEKEEKKKQQEKKQGGKMSEVKKIEKEMESRVSEILEYLNQKKEQTVIRYKENDLSYEEAYNTWILDPKDKNFMQVLEKFLLLIKKLDPTVYIINQFPNKLKDSFKKNKEIIKKLGIPGAEDSSYINYLCLVKDSGQSILENNKHTNLSYLISNGVVPNDYINGLYIFLAIDRFKMSTMGDNWDRLASQGINKKGVWGISNFIELNNDFQYTPIKKSFFKSDIYLRNDRVLKNYGRVEEWDYCLRINKPEECGQTNNLLKIFKIFNKISKSFENKIENLRENFYNNLETGISDDLLLKQIGEPQDWEVVKKTKNSTKVHLFYNGFVNRLGNKKYKRRLDIINDELTGIKDGEFAVKSGSNGAKYEAEKGASKSEAPKEEEAEKNVAPTDVSSELEKNKKLIQNKKDFFNGNNLTILPNGNVRDENFEEYELEEDRYDFIVYKPEGMRGKRAYIKTDSEKNYLAWSGPIKIADKSKFLRGDFEKAKEEVKSSQETAVNEKEDENIEPPHEETEINDATEDIGAKLEKLTKLYNEGVLSKEELKKKSDELISQI